MNMQNTGAVNMHEMGREKERERERGGGEQGEEREGDTGWRKGQLCVGDLLCAWSWATSLNRS